MSHTAFSFLGRRFDFGQIQKSGTALTEFSAQHLLRPKLKVFSVGLSSRLGSLGRDVLQIVRVTGKSLMAGSLRFHFLLAVHERLLSAYLFAAHGPHHMVPSLLKANSGKSP